MRNIITGLLLSLMSTVGLVPKGSYKVKTLTTSSNRQTAGAKKKDPYLEYITFSNPLLR